MRIKFLEAISGTTGSFAPGDTADWDTKDAKRLIEAGIAQPADSPRTKKKTETAADKTPVETATE